jgi:predicted nucleotidyltransferase
LSPTVERLLADLVQAAQRCFRDNLKSLILFGSGAEGRLRATSDLNLLIVLVCFDREQVDAFAEPLAVAQAAARASGMFVLHSELARVAEAFAVKFDDIARRRRVLYGDDVMAHLEIPRAATKARLRQVLVNLVLRLRWRYATANRRDDQLTLALADSTGPLRSAAATLLELEGTPVSSPKDALAKVAASIEGSGWSSLLAQLSTAREQRALPAGAAGPAVLDAIALATAMLARAERIE